MVISFFRAAVTAMAASISFLVVAVAATSHAVTATAASTSSSVVAVAATLHAAGLL